MVRKYEKQSIFENLSRHSLEGIFASRLQNIRLRNRQTEYICEDNPSHYTL